MPDDEVRTRRYPRPVIGIGSVGIAAPAIIVWAGASGQMPWVAAAPLVIAMVFVAASSISLKWDEIERFRLGRYRVLPAICRVDLRDGRVLHASGIRATPAAGLRASGELINDLNAHKYGHS